MVSCISKQFLVRMLRGSRIYNFTIYTVQFSNYCYAAYGGECLENCLFLHIINKEYSSFRNREKPPRAKWKKIQAYENTEKWLKKAFKMLFLKWHVIVCP